MTPCTCDRWRYADLAQELSVRARTQGWNHCPFCGASLTAPEKPIVVCLCGSSKFPYAHMQAMMEETLAGRIVIPMGLYGHADFPKGAKDATCDGDESMEVKQMLDKLHFAKIDMADEIMVVAIGGYVGDSTKREIAHAIKTGKTVRYYSPEKPMEEADDAEFNRKLEDKIKGMNLNSSDKFEFKRYCQFRRKRHLERTKRPLPTQPEE